MGEPGPSFADILAAADRLRGRVRQTPLVKSRWLSAHTGGEVYLKLECWQHLGAFKVRGMLNRALTLTAAERAAGVVVASSGNHGVAASWCGGELGIDVEVFVPRPTPEAKVAKIRYYGARLHLAGEGYDEACQAAKEYRAAHPAKVWVDSCADPVAVAGHGTIGLELGEDLAAFDEVLVPVGGGGLITGVGAALRELRPGVRVTAVQTEACPALAASLRDGVCYETYPTEPSVCEALVGGIGDLVFRRAGECIDRVVLAAEGSIEQAVVGMIRHEQVLAEPSAAIGWAYVHDNPAELTGRRTVVVISGANVDYGLLRRLMASNG